jgi:biotin carboxylase
MTSPDPPGRVLLIAPTHTYRAGAFLAAAGRLGIPVTVASERPHALTGLNPAGFLQVDFEDPEAATEAILAFAGTYPLDAVIAPEDDGLILAAMASDALTLSAGRLPAVRAARNKLAMREQLAQAGLPSPWYQAFPVEADPTAVARQVPYPCVVKPLSLSGSRGVIRADTPEGFAAGFRRVAEIVRQPEVAAREGAMARRLLVEGYLPGQEVALEGLIDGGELQVLAIFDKPDPLEGPYFEETIYVTPSRHAEAVQQALAEAAGQAAAALGITSGPIHAEMRFSGRDVWVIEVAPRSIGGHCARALRFAGGLSLEELTLQQALGRGSGGIQREKSASGVMMIPIPRAGVLDSVEGQDSALKVPGIEEILISIGTGQPVTPLPEGNQYLGFIFARSDGPSQVEAALRAAHGRLRFDIIGSHQEE